MNLFVALGYSVPDYFQTLPTTTLLLLALSLLVGLVLPTYRETAIGAAAVALIWVIVALALGLPVHQEPGLSLAVILGLALAAILAHTVRRVANAGWRHVRKQP